MKTTFYAMTGAASLAFTSCSIDVTQNRPVNAATGTVYRMSRDSSREILRASIEAELAKDYFVATTNEGSNFTAYSREGPSRDQIQVSIISHDESSTRSNEYAFQIVNRGSISNARAASRFARSLRAMADAASNPSSTTE